MHGLPLMPMVVIMATHGFFFMSMRAVSVPMVVCVESPVSHGFFSCFVYWKP